MFENGSAGVVISRSEWLQSFCFSASVRVSGRFPVKYFGFEENKEVNQLNIHSFYPMCRDQLRSYAQCGRIIANEYFVCSGDLLLISRPYRGSVDVFFS